MKFKSDIEVQAGLKDSSGSNGLSGQVLSSNGTTVSWINAGGSFAETVKNQVKASVAINKGQAVYETGADGTNIVVGLASNASEATSSKTLGLLDATVAINGFANVVQIGKLSGLNTSGATAGDPVWLGVNGNLIYGLANKPYAPKHLVFIGIVTRVNANNGEIFINIQNGFELNEIHDVDLITNVPINGDILGFNGTLWVNKTIAGWLGYTPANDANVVHNTGNETISGVKTFSNNIIGNAFVKSGGTVDQYLKADGSVSTAMNSRVEVNFIATSGQTTFTTPYEVGQVEVYYNGSKLYPNEFTATNGTDVVLAQAATLGAQISIVKYVSSFTTTSIRNESVFTTTGGQTTFAVNYAPGQVDVFYNGSKLSPAEFTATNGTSVVLGFACAAGESIVIDSFVNQVSGANGTANRVSKFTGVASLGDSQIDDNGTNVSIGYDINPDTYKLDVAGTGKFDGALLADSFATLSGTSSQFLKANGSVDSTSYLPRTGGTLTGALNGTRASFTQTSATDTLYGFNGYAGGIGLTGGAQDGTGGYFVNNSATYPVVKLLGISPTLLIEGSNNSGVKFTVSTTGNIYTAGNVLIGTTTDSGYKLDVNGSVAANRFVSNVTNGYGLLLNRSAVTTYNGISLQTANSAKWFLGMRENLSSNNYIIYNENTSTDVVTVNAANNNVSILGGKVGVGTSNLTYNFQVQKTSISAPAMMISGAYYGGPRLQVYGLESDANAWMGLGSDMSGGTYEHSIYFPNYSGSGRLSFGSYNGTTYAEKMCVNASGFVGIGTGASTADYQLKVSSSSIFTGGFTSSGGETILQVNNTAANGRNWFIISGGTTGSFSGGKFGIYNATNYVEAFTISAVGNVGIGSINPLYSLGRTLTVEGTGIFQTPVGGGNYNENLRLNRTGNGYASIIIGGAYNSVSGYTTGQWALAATPSTMGYRFDFDYSGATVATINTSGGYIQVSDRNKKKDFEESNIGLDAILGLKPTLYRMKGDSDEDKKQLGFIAQEVKEFIPQAYTETVDGFIGLHDRPIIAALVKAIQELKAEIEILKNK